LAAKKKAAGPPEPSPAHRKLDYFAGKWRHEGEIKPSPYGPGGKFTYTETCEWFAGGFALVSRSEGEVPEGTMKGLSILGWDPAEKSYAYFEINSTGEVLHSRGTVRGKIWTSQNASKRLLNGKPVRTRMTLTQVSRDLATYKFEMAAPGQPMRPVMTGKQTRIG
jgi:hypothetical protein